MLSDRLKEQTLAHHQQLEKLLVGKIKSVDSEAAYINLLQLFYSYFGGLEDRINLFITGQQLPDHKERRKTDSLVQDIKTLGAEPDPKVTEEDLPVIDNVAKAFGALYVIEGSTLGGSIISKMISGRIGLQKALSFFNGYGNNSQKMWADFKTVLNNMPAGEENDIIKTANNTFLYFETWINKSDINSAISRLEK